MIDTNDVAPSALELEELAERIAIQLVWRWGIVTYELFAEESYRVPWRYVAWALRRLEARGEVVGGRFVEGLAGEQYAHHDALDALARESQSESVTLAGCDPLNLTGGIVASQRIPSRVNQTMTLVGGDVVDVS